MNVLWTLASPQLFCGYFIRHFMALYNINFLPAIWAAFLCP
jgi:hypothetical protein